jgi:hypothetical protein
VDAAGVSRKQSARPGKGNAQPQDLHATQASDSEAGFVVVHVSIRHSTSVNPSAALGDPCARKESQWRALAGTILHVQATASIRVNHGCWVSPQVTADSPIPDNVLEPTSIEEAEAQAEVVVQGVPGPGTVDRRSVTRGRDTSARGRATRKVGRGDQGQGREFSG